VVVEGLVGRFPWGYVLIAFGLGILASSIFLYATNAPAPASATKQGATQRTIRAD
jgi:hypothetical protein